MIAKARQLLLVDDGSYSDYGVLGFFIVLAKFEPLVQLEKYLAENPEQNKSYSFKPDGFLNFLLGKGFLLEIGYDTLHLDENVDEVTFRVK